MLGPGDCRPRANMSSSTWDADAYVTASRVTFAQTVFFLKSLAGPNPIQLPTSVPVPTLSPTTSGAPSPTPVGSPGTTIVDDSLNHAENGILPSSSDDPSRYSRGYVNNEYSVNIPSISVFPGNLPNQVSAELPARYGDASLSVAVRLTNPSVDQFVTVACRAVGLTSGYRLTVYPTSAQFQLARWFGGQGYTLSGIQSSKAIHAGSQMNVLELNCHGPNIDAAANGDRLTEVMDYSLTAGQLWIGAGQSANPVAPGARTPAGAAIDAAFSDLVVRQQ